MTENKRILCDVFKTRKKDEMYLYVEKKEGFSRVPDELMDMFGKPELAMTLLLTPDKNL
ncbi:MAG: YcgL domain-containing protein, partial [Pseudomonadota bacterium]|nr:YcgL domain-containing protein [Pseudomonadota bacterium]